MTYSQEAIVSELLSYYEFLVRLCLPCSSLKLPPPGGWPNITPKRFEALHKNDSAINLLKHIPYISEDDTVYGCEHEITKECVCNDYRGERGQKLIVKNCDPECYADPGELTSDDDSYAWLYDPHVVTLGRSKGGDNGCWMFCNTENGQMSLVDIMFQHTRTRPDATTFFAALKEDLISLRIVPYPGDEILLRRPRVRGSETIEEKEEVKIIRKHGWPSGDYQKEKCLEELRALEEKKSA